MHTLLPQVSLRLDTSRNELLIANTALSILACSIAFSAYITGNLTGLAFPSFIKVINRNELVYRSIWNESGQCRDYRENSKSVLRDHCFHFIPYVCAILCVIVVLEMDRNASVSYSVQKWHVVNNTYINTQHFFILIKKSSFFELCVY